MDTFTPEQVAFWRRWIDALRSGSYLQDTESLRTPQGYCCLGVGCDVSGKGKWSTQYAFSVESAIWTAQPASAYHDWLGLTYLLSDFRTATYMVEDPRGPMKVWRDEALVEEDRPKKNLIETCVCLNDDSAWSFKQIANWLESLAQELGVF